MKRWLNLYAGLGGNRKHWTDCEVTAVEMDEKVAEIYMQQHPNDKMIIGDAHQYLLDHYQEYDGIWSSPPCPTHSKMAKATRHPKKSYPDMRLYQEILFLQHFFTGPWIVENVDGYYEPLIPAKKVGRHLFWTNFDFVAVDTPTPPNFIDSVSKQDLMNWLGIHYEGNIYLNGNHCHNQALRNCCHPDLGLQLFNAANGIPPDLEQMGLML